MKKLMEHINKLHEINLQMRKLTSVTALGAENNILYDEMPSEYVRGAFDTAHEISRECETELCELVSQMEMYRMELDKSQPVITKLDNEQAECVLDVYYQLPESGQKALRGITREMGIAAGAELPLEL